MNVPALRLAGSAVLTAVVLVICACATRTESIPGVKLRVPTTPGECKAAGAQWTRLGFSERCDVRTSDAGKMCTDSAQCQGTCQAAPEVAVGQLTSGSCSPYVSNFGRQLIVEHGRAVEYFVE